MEVLDKKFTGIDKESEMLLEKYSFGVGDRFGHQGKAQLQGIMQAASRGVEIVPVWNKSNREHTIIGTDPQDVRRGADAAVKAAGWHHSYYVDADHIHLENVSGFLKPSNFFTIDVADYIGQRAGADRIGAFVSQHAPYTGRLRIPGIDGTFDVSRQQLEAIANKYLNAIVEAGKIYRHIASVKGAGTFVTEVSMDENNVPQTPVEVFFILAAIAQEGIPAQTIAPKFTGSFHKGVDYVGDVKQFAKEFEQDIAVIALAVKEFGLPENLKLSIHSGSDKFSIYASINKALKKFNAGLHLKTAGTTWLEEIIGLAIAGGEGLAIAKHIYEEGYRRFDELCAPYMTVVEIERDKLVSPKTVNGWGAEDFANALRHDVSCPQYDIHFRQLMHLAYKIAAEMGEEFINALEEHEDSIAPCVTANIYERHIKPLFIEQD
jgi:hypothetical protein